MEKKDFKNALNRAVGQIITVDRLTYEGSVVELCKIVLIKFYYEKKNLSLLSNEVVKKYIGTSNWEKSIGNLFRSYVPINLFKEWDNFSICQQSFDFAVNELSNVNFSQIDTIEYGRQFTNFLRLQFGGFFRDNSTPEVLTKYIIDSIDWSNVNSVFDPCCGLGGFLAEAYSGKIEKMKLTGCDIDFNMVNITRLHLKLYGYEGDRFYTDDFTFPKESYQTERFDCILAHIPSRKMVFSMAGSRNIHFGGRQSDESLFIGRILRMLNPNGIAAIIVSSTLLENRREREVREDICMMSEVVNITRFENIPDEDDPNRLINYHIIFLRSKFGDPWQKTTATLFEENTKQEKIDNSANWMRNGNDSRHMPANTIRFDVFDSEEWNISLSFVREEVNKVYPAVKLDDILLKKRIKACVEEYGKYRLLRVRNNGLGVEVKETKEGFDIHGDRYVAYRGDLLISSFEADHGGIGIVPSDCDCGLVIKDLYLFEIDRNRVDPDFLVLVLCSNQVQKQFKQMNKGRFALARLSLAKILSVMIPLPDIDTQRAMARKLQRYIIRAQKAEEDLKEGREKFGQTLFGKAES